MTYAKIVFSLIFDHFLAYISKKYLKNVRKKMLILKEILYSWQLVLVERE